MIFTSILFLGLLLFFPETALAGSKYGATLWLTQLLPTLLPFFIAIRLFDSCLPQVSCRRIFLLTGILCGYPAGASLVTNQYDKGLLTKKKAYFYMGFVNNPSPMFILVFCGTTVLGLSFHESVLLFGMTIAASLSGSLLFLLLASLPFPPFKKYFSQKKEAFHPAEYNKKANEYPDTPPAVTQETFSARLDHIILDSFILLVKIGGYVIIFSILGQFINYFSDNLSAPSVLFSGLLEITSGISYLQAAPFAMHTKKALMLAILSFGGLSAAAQTNSILTRSELSILPYLIIKTGNSLLSCLLLYIL